MVFWGRATYYYLFIFNQVSVSLVNQLIIWSIKCQHVVSAYISLYWGEWYESRLKDKVKQSKTSLYLSLCFSSEDELDVLLNGTPEQKKKLIREYLTGESESSSGDEFEKEMEAELSSTIRTMEGTWGPSASGNTHLQLPWKDRLCMIIYYTGHILHYMDMNWNSAVWLNLAHSGILRRW